jgi:predicted house-cleaning noncanonical NTP pyrophosphatase (MazG superfamily)
MAEITRIYYNKLVRDNIPAKIEAKRIECGVRRVTDAQELQQELFKKVREEAASLSTARTKEEFLDEFSDLMVVLEALVEQLEIPKSELDEARKANVLNKGRYKHAHFLEWSADTDYKTEESPQGIPM